MERLPVTATFRMPGASARGSGTSISLEPRIGEPLCRQAFGTMRWTMRSRIYLLFSMFGTVCYDPNAQLIYQPGPAFQMKLIEGSGRFEGWTGTGVWELFVRVDDSGTSGTTADNFPTVFLNRR
jgi:hypothetical protein